MEQNQVGKGAFSVLPFYIFITLLLGMLGTTTILSLFQAGDALRAGVSAGLLILHIGMYWLNLKSGKSRRWWALYYTLQTVLIVAISVLLYGRYAIGISVLGSMTLCLIGEALGWWGNSRTALYLGLFYSLLAGVLILLLVDRTEIFFALSNLFVNGGFIVLLMVVLNQQLAERQKAVDLAEQLESANARLAASAARIESLTLQNERQRIARELHDTLAQGLSGLVLQLEAVRAHLASSRVERASAIVDQALGRARGTLAESRAAIDDLRLAAADLPRWVREKVDRFTQVTGIPCELELSVQDDQLMSETADHALGILSESLANVARHARATQARVKFLVHRDQLQLEVHDNGKGFDLDQQTDSGHYGLLGMRERAHLTGGVLTIESPQQGGTKVSFRVGDLT